ncbi:hypothetical protein [Streptomyces sp. NPDC057438]|uniref:hypothetical protein n=1 Tax=Streptomyces sp. NPDC057438 TaxID=3346133 RepID=UPI0036CAAEC8
MSESFDVGQQRPEIDRQTQRVAVALQVAGHLGDLSVGYSTQGLRGNHDLEVRGDRGLRDRQPAQQVADARCTVRVDQHLVVEPLVRVFLFEYPAVEAGVERGAPYDGSGGQHGQGQHRHDPYQRPDQR